MFSLPKHIVLFLISDVSMLVILIPADRVINHSWSLWYKKCYPKVLKQIYLARSGKWKLYILMMVRIDVQLPRQLTVRLNKTLYGSQLVTEWKINAACAFVFCFCLFVCLVGCLFVCFLIVGRSVKYFNSVTTFVQYEIWNFVFWWAWFKSNVHQSTKFKNLVVQCVLLCTSHFVMFILDLKK